MVKTLMKQIKEYKKDSLLTMLFAALEVILEIIIPLLMASLIDKGIEAGNMSNAVSYTHLVLCFFLKKNKKICCLPININVKNKCIKNNCSILFLNVD